MVKGCCKKTNAVLAVTTDWVKLILIHLRFMDLLLGNNFNHIFLTLKISHDSIVEGRYVASAYMLKFISMFIRNKRRTPPEQKKFRIHMKALKIKGW